VPQNSQIKKPKDHERKNNSYRTCKTDGGLFEKTKVNAKVEFSYGATEIKAGY
jgi:hypothetical protein